MCSRMLASLLWGKGRRKGRQNSTPLIGEKISLKFSCISLVLVSCSGVGEPWLARYECWGTLGRIGCWVGNSQALLQHLETSYIITLMQTDSKNEVLQGVGEKKGERTLGGLEWLSKSRILNFRWQKVDRLAQAETIEEPRVYLRGLRTELIFSLKLLS